MKHIKYGGLCSCRSICDTFGYVSDGRQMTQKSEKIRTCQDWGSSGKLRSLDLMKKGEDFFRNVIITLKVSLENARIASGFKKKPDASLG